MCYPKPGPRCSAHTAVELAAAQLQYDADPTDDDAKRRLEAAQLAYAKSPRGIKEIKEHAMTVRDIGEQIALFKRARLFESEREEQLANMKTVLGSRNADEGGSSAGDASVMHSSFNSLSDEQVLKLVQFKGQIWDVEDLDYRLEEQGGSWIVSGFADYVDENENGQTFRFEQRVDLSALVSAGQDNDSQGDSGSKDESSPEGVDYAEMTDTQRLTATEVMFGTDSPQYRKAAAKLEKIA